MKVMKKISAIVLALCLSVSCFSMVADAADGRISFNDPSTAVGEFVEVECTVRTNSDTLGDIEVKLKYDSDSLRFKSGDGVEKTEDGILTCTATGDSTEEKFTIKFQALKEGTAKVTVSDALIKDEDGSSLSLDEGTSAVKIAEGDPSKIEEEEDTASSENDVQVEVNGVSYTLTDNFADADIPLGYSRTQRTLDGVERQMVENSTATICLAYMIGGDDEGDFFLYVEENATFAPYEEITISDTTSIVVLSDTSKVELPDTYQEAKLTLNGKDFPVWQDTEKEGYYVLYAMNSNGEEGYYQYDSVESTYQRIEPKAAEPVEEETVKAPGFLGKIQELIEANMAIAILAIGLGGILLLLILIILAIKLHNRNVELDELYDEYGIDLEEEEEVKPSKKDKKKDKKDKKKDKKKGRKKYDEDDFEDDFLEDSWDFEDDFEYEEVPVKKEKKAPKAAKPAVKAEKPVKTAKPAPKTAKKPVKKARPAVKEEEVFAGYTQRNEITIDDLDEMLNSKPAKRRGHIDVDDTFKVDFIDLD